VAALLREFKGSLTLVDVNAEGSLSGLITRPGLNTWNIDFDTFLSGETTEKEKCNTLAKLPDITETMAPPSLLEEGYMHLEYCLRILPHDQDTGGFFVAVLQLSDLYHIVHDRDDNPPTLISDQEALSVQAKLGYNPKRRAVG